MPGDFLDAFDYYNTNPHYFIVITRNIFSIPQKKKFCETIIIFDVSYSCKWLANYSNKSLQELYQKELNSILQTMPANDKLGVLFVGQKIKKIFDISPARPSMTLPSIEINDESSCIEDSIEYAKNMFANSGKNTIIIYTDGLIKIDDPYPMDTNYDIYWRYIEQDTIAKIEDVSILSIKSPLYVRNGYMSQGSLKIFSSHRTLVIITVTVDENIIYENTVLVPDKGIYRYFFVWQVNTEKTKQNIVATVQSLEFDDYISENNQYKIEVFISGKLKILEFGNQLSSLNYKQFIITSDEINVRDFSDYDVIVISDQNASRLLPLFPAIELAVAQGTGLFMLASYNTFAAGGYQNTIIEKILPVDCTSGDNENLHVFLLLDSSGSMNEIYQNHPKIEVAKNAICFFVDKLKNDMLVTFSVFSEDVDNIFKWLPAQEKEKMISAILATQAFGKTNLIGALEHIKKVYEETSGDVQTYTILISDGGSLPSDVAKFLEGIPKNSSLSVIATGERNIEPLQKIAAWGQGSFYLANEKNIEELLQGELYKRSGDSIQQVNSYLRVHKTAFANWSWEQYSDIPIFKYATIKNKSQARCLLETNSGNAILSVGNYRLGKSAAMATNLASDWSKDFVVPGKEIIGTTISWLSRRNSNLNFEVVREDFADISNFSIIMEEQPIHNRKFSLYSQEQGDKLNFREIKPGYYEAKLQKSQLGKKVVISENNDEKMSIVLTQPYHPELANMTGQSILNNSINPINHKQEEQNNSVYIIISLLLFLLERFLYRKKV